MASFEECLCGNVLVLLMTAPRFVQHTMHMVHVALTGGSLSNVSFLLSTLLQTGQLTGQDFCSITVFVIYWCIVAQSNLFREGFRGMRRL